MIKNNIEIDVKVKCIEADKTQAKLAAAIGSTPPYINRLVRKNDVVVNKTFVKMMEELATILNLPMGEARLSPDDRRKCGPLWLYREIYRIPGRTI